MTINYRDLVIEAEVSRRRGIGTVPRNRIDGEICLMWSRTRRYRLRVKIP
jgi:hypothetical protein